jgi:dTDP-4-amino-4,6-dideoxygalactose transaminase
MAPILDVAANHGWVVIEDAAQAIGAEYQGRRAGSMGDYGCFSFFPSKNLGAFGDGGIVTTKDPQVYERLKILRTHGAKPKYYHQVVGGNFRLDALQAAIVAVKLDYLDGWTAARQDNAARYRDLFASAGLTDRVTFRWKKRTVTSTTSSSSALTPIGTTCGPISGNTGSDPRCTTRFPCTCRHVLRVWGTGAGDFPVSEQAADQTLALPIYPELTESQQIYVVEQIDAFLNR